MMASLETTDIHLSELDLHQLAESPERDDLTAPRLHIATCTDCREKLSLLQEAQSGILANADHLSSTSHQSELAAKLHATCHQLAMEKNLANAQAYSSDTAQKPLSVGQLLRNCINWRLPAVAAPGIAFASFALAFVIFGGIFESSQSVSSFQDSDLLVLHAPAAKPGLGFFHNDGTNEKLVESYSGFQISSSDQYINIRWQAIDQAIGYQVELFEISDGVSQSVKKTETEYTQWKLERDTLRPGQLYRLNLTGSTTENYRFRHTGGFILR